MDQQNGHPVPAPDAVASPLDGPSDIVQACARLIDREGLSGVSIRKLSQLEGIEAPRVYEHFKSKDSLLRAVHVSTLDLLREHLFASDAGTSPKEKLLSTGMGYIEFAQTRPGLFTLLFTHGKSQRAELATAAPPRSAYTVLQTRVDDYAGVLPHEQREMLSFGLWSIVHGAAVLQHTHLQGFDSAIHKFTRHNLERFLSGWEHHLGLSGG